MSKESFARGFCKVAAEHGVDPVELLKKLSQQTKKESGKETRNAGSEQMPGGYPPYIKGYADAPKRSAWLMQMKDKIRKASLAQIR